MAAYYGRDNGWMTGLFVAHNIIWIYVLAGIVYLYYLYNCVRKGYRQGIEAKVPCKHGITGAFYGHAPCPKCQEEKAAQEEEEAAQKKAEKERAYRECVAKIRLTGYLQKMDPEKFEHLICDLFQRMGYEVESTPYSSDGGIDGFLRKSGELSILQCKRVKGAVGQPILRDLFGTMNHEKAKEGIVVTTGTVSKRAKGWAKDKPIRIIELEELQQLIGKYYSENDLASEEFDLQGIRKHRCPNCGHRLRVVNWHGKRFLGCTAYPACRFTRPLLE